MLGSPFGKWLWDSRRSLFGWTSAIVVVGGGYAAFWPTIDTPGMQEAIASYPQGLLDALNYNDVSTASGYLTASVYGLLVAVLLTVYAISAGTRLIAGDEEAGTLDLVVAHPVSRTRLALERFASFFLSLVIIAAVFWLGMVALIVPAQLDDIAIGHLAAAHLHLVLFGAFFGALAYAVGAASGGRSVAIAVGSAAGVLGYVANGIIPQVNGLEWVEEVSPFDWLTGGNPLRNGVQVGDCLLMAGLIVILVGWGTWAFNRRDLGV